jgi:hypothetical protein
MLSGSSISIGTLVKAGLARPAWLVGSARRQAVIAVAVPVAGEPFIPIEDQPAG